VNENSSILSFAIGGSNGPGERGKHEAPGKRVSTIYSDPSFFNIFNISDKTQPSAQISTS